jgi:hypothetical protein
VCTTCCCQLCDQINIHAFVISSIILFQIIDVAGSSDAHDAWSDNYGNTGSKRLPDSETNASVQLLKKPRKTSPQPALFSFQKHKGPEKPLIMPPPTHEHQVQK